MNTKKLFSIILISGVFASCTVNYKKDTNPITNFNALWEIIDTKYCFFEEKNMDWDSIKYVYEPKVRVVKTELELFDVFAQMLNELQDGHVNLYSPFDISRCKSFYDNYPTNYNSSVVYGERYLTGTYKIAGGFHYNKIASDSIGLIRYSSFSNAFSAANLRYIDNYFKECKGIIIDVRHNGGGNANYSKMFASCFFREKTLIGYIKHKIGNGHNDFSEPQAIYIDPRNRLIDWSNKKVMVLCNRMSYSATNNFLSAVSYAPNVCLVGGISGGGGGLPLSNELPIGWLVRFSAVPTYNAEMQSIEFGIEPDTIVNCDSVDATKGIDTIIEKAVELINQQ